jgi:hypothetical protein
MIYNGMGFLFDSESREINDDMLYFPTLIAMLFDEFGINLKEIASGINNLASEFIDLFNPLDDRNIDRAAIVRHNDWNKPILTMIQTTVLFKILKDKKVIMRDIDNTKMAKAINNMTGFSPNTIRQNFKTNISEMIEKQEDVKILQDLLSEIVVDLEKEKSKLLL